MIRHRAFIRGIEPSDFDRVKASVQNWADWPEAWAALAATDRDRASRYQQAGWHISAGQAQVRSGLAYHFAKLFAVQDDAAYREMTLNSVEAIRAGLTLLDHRFERIEVPFDGHYIVGNLRFPKGVERPPLALLIPGTESVKEEFPRWEEEFLIRGLATLSMDGPGQGEVGFERRIRPDYDVPVSTMLDAIASRDDLDLTRVGAAGMSLGGYYALRAAAFEPRIRAVTVNGSPRNLGATWDLIAPMYKAKFIWNLGASSDAEAEQKALALDLAPVIHRIEVPALVVYGGADPLLNFEVDGRQLVDELKRGELWTFPEGNHGVTNFATEHLGPAADWMLANFA
jgi:2,6-dihydroxypseudooxynicotine hydrolase